MRKELQKKIDRAIKLLKSAEKKAKEFNEPVEICYSGGKDSDVILELAKMSGINYKAIYKNTTIDPSGTKSRSSVFSMVQKRIMFTVSTRYLIGQMKMSRSLSRNEG